MGWIHVRIFCQHLIMFVIFLVQGRRIRGVLCMSVQLLLWILRILFWVFVWIFGVVQICYSINCFIISLFVNFSFINIINARSIINWLTIIIGCVVELFLKLPIKYRRIFLVLFLLHFSLYFLPSYSLF